MQEIVMTPSSMYSTNPNATKSTSANARLNSTQKQLALHQLGRYFIAKSLHIKLSAFALLVMSAICGCNNSSTQPIQPTSPASHNDSVATDPNTGSTNTPVFSIIISAETPNLKTLKTIEFVWITSDSIAHTMQLVQTTSATSYSGVAKIDSAACGSGHCFGFVRAYDSTKSFYTTFSYFSINTGIISYNANQFTTNSQYNTSGLSLVPKDSSAAKWAATLTRAYQLDSISVYDTLNTDTINYTLGNDINIMKGGGVDNVTPAFSKSFDSLTFMYGFCFRDTLNSSSKKVPPGSHIDSLLRYLQTYLSDYNWNTNDIFVHIYFRYNLDNGCFNNGVNYLPKSVSDTVSVYRTFHQIITEFTAKRYLKNAPIDGFQEGKNRFIKDIPKGAYWDANSTHVSNTLNLFHFTRHVTGFKATYIFRTNKRFYRRIK